MSETYDHFRANALDVKKLTHLTPAWRETPPEERAAIRQKYLDSIPHAHQTVAVPSQAGTAPKV